MFSDIQNYSRIFLTFFNLVPIFFLTCTSVGGGWGAQLLNQATQKGRFYVDPLLGARAERVLPCNATSISD